MRQGQGVSKGKFDSRVNLERPYSIFQISLQLIPDAKYRRKKENISSGFLIMHLIIDGYNLIRQSGTFRRFEKVSLEEGRHALIHRLSIYKQQTGHRITVVFDAWESGSPTEERDRYGGIDILYSRRGQTADELIKRLIQSRREEMVVVTSDRDIVDFAFRRGTTAIPSPEFESRLLEPETRPTHAKGGGASDRDEENQDREKMTPGTKKKGPSRRLSKKQRAILSVFRKL
jgi:uncharacterized protein